MRADSRSTPMTKTYDYDLFVIGAGSGGVRASRIAASHGARVAVAEEHQMAHHQLAELVVQAVQVGSY